MTCQLVKEGEKLSAFEAACWNWYQRNVTPFALECGSIGRLVERLGLAAAVERFFMRGLNMVRQYDLRNQAEDRKS